MQHHQYISSQLALVGGVCHTERLCKEHNAQYECKLLKLQVAEGESHTIAILWVETPLEAFHWV